jgi:hypothetical protein
LAATGSSIGARLAKVLVTVPRRGFAATGEAVCAIGSANNTTRATNTRHTDTLNFFTSRSLLIAT